MIKIIRKIKNKIKIKAKAIKNKFNVIKNAIDTQELLFNIDKSIIKSIKRFIIRFRQNKNKPMLIIRILLGSRMIIVILSILLIYKTMLFYDKVEIGADALGETYEMTLIFIIVTLCPLLFIRKDKNRFTLGILIDIILSILLFADNLYWKFSANILSVSQVTYVKYAEEITNTLPYFLEIWQIKYFIDIPILIIIWIISRNTIKKKEDENKRKHRKKKNISWCYMYINFN